MSEASQSQRNENYAYQGVKQEIIDHIGKPENAGNKLPSERDWCELLAVSRSTVRQALQAMEGEGRIQRKRGSGWYVSAPPLLFSTDSHLPFTYTAIKQGRKPSWQQVAIGMALPGSGVAGAFGIGSGREVPRLEMLLELDALAVGLETSFINPGCCTGPGEIDHSLPISDELRRISSTGSLHYRMSIRSSTCGIHAAGQMGVHAESPALLMTQWIDDTAGMTLAVIETTWRANALEFVVDQVVRE